MVHLNHICCATTECVLQYWRHVYYYRHLSMLESQLSGNNIQHMPISYLMLFIFYLLIK